MAKIFSGSLCTFVINYFLICDLYGCFCKKWIYGGKNSWFINAVHFFQLTVAIEKLVNSHVDVLIIFVCVIPDPHPLIQHSWCLRVNYVTSHHRYFRASSHVLNVGAWRRLRYRHVVGLRYVRVGRVCRGHHGVVIRDGTMTTSSMGPAILDVLRVAVITLKGQCTQLVKMTFWHAWCFSVISLELANLSPINISFALLPCMRLARGKSDQSGFNRREKLDCQCKLTGKALKSGNFSHWRRD